MKFILEKMKDGVLDVSKVDTEKLIEWSNNSSDWREKDALGHEIIYRVGE